MPDINLGSLRPLCKEDLAMVLRWRNSDRIRNSMLSNHIISWEEHQAWFKRLKENDVYLIFEFAQEPVGLVYFTDMEPSERICWWGFYIGKDGMPRGTGLLMGYMGLSHIFDTLQILLLRSKVLASNQVSQAYHERLGFIRENTISDIVRNGERHEVLNYSYQHKNWLGYRSILKNIIKNI